ncbi:MAG: hypothetical protein ABIT04_09740 [Novosphingobium sp.]
MAAIRVTIGEMPPLLRSLVEGILTGNPQFEVAPAARQMVAVGNAPHPTDVHIVSEDSMKSILPIAVAAGVPVGLGVVAIAANGLDAAVVRLNAHRQRIGREPRQTLAEAIRAAAGIPSDAG